MKISESELKSKFEKFFVSSSNSILNWEALWAGYLQCAIDCGILAGEEEKNENN